MEDTPPVPNKVQKSRFGNIAFKTFYEKVSKVSNELILKILPEKH